MAKLIDNTVVVHPKTGEPVLLAATGELPDWAVDLVGDHLLDGPRPKAPSASAGDSAEVARLRARVAELEQQSAERLAGAEPERIEVPPRSGPGSGADRWRAYATAQGVEVPGNASREDVIKALDEAQKPTE